MAQTRIRKKLDKLSADPSDKSLDVKKLTNSSYFRLRVGDYRVIYDIVDDELIIKIVDVAHRQNIYKE